MKYKGNDYNMWDAWYMNVKGRVHGFHLKAQDSLWNVGHVVTDDLLHFTKCEDILKPLDEKTHPDDCLGKYTGCAYYDEKSGRAYVYYTMRDKNCSEKIGVAISEDLENFIEYKGNPVLEIDKSIFNEKSKPSGATDCRDMLVIKDEKSDLYYGYFAAMANIDGKNKGVIGAAVSDDLISWREQRIVYIPRFNGVIEVPDVFFLDGKWYLTFLTGNRYGAKGNVSDSNVCAYTLYAVSDSPDGPFEEPCDNIFICGTYNSGYSCRSVEFEGKRYVLYIENSEYGAALSLPKEIKVIDGRLCPCYADILSKLRTGKALCNYDAETFEALSTSFAWQTFGGEIHSDGSCISVISEEYDCQRFLAKDFAVNSIEAEAKITAYCNECGFVLRTLDKNGKEVQTYTFSMNFDFNELSVYSESCNVLALTPFMKRKFAFEKERRYHVRVIAGEGQFEIYIDGVLVLQGNMLTADSIKPGLFSAKGKANFDSLSFYELEK